MEASVKKAIQKLIDEIRTVYVKNPHADNEHRLDLETATAIARFLWSVGYEQNDAQRGKIPHIPLNRDIPLPQWWKDKEIPWDEPIGFGFKD